MLEISKLNAWYGASHALQDVSSKSYDRWHYLPEKRAGMMDSPKRIEAVLPAEMRDELEASQVGESQRTQSAVSAANSEIVQMQATVQSLRSAPKRSAPWVS